MTGQMDIVPSVDELREIIVRVLSSGVGGEHAFWRDRVGDVERLPPDTDCNWRVHPSGDEEAIEMVTRASRLVRQYFPYVTK